MSCADVCLDHDADCDNEFYSEVMRKARKPYTCCECGETIQAGVKYERVTGKNDGSMWTVKSCAECAEIRKAFVCGTWIFGQLWESIRESMFPIWNERGPIDCLAEVESLAARDKLREEYRDWREDEKSCKRGGDDVRTAD